MIHLPILGNAVQWVPTPHGHAFAAQSQCHAQLHSANSGVLFIHSTQLASVRQDEVVFTWGIIQEGKDVIPWT